MDIYLNTGRGANVGKNILDLIMKAKQEAMCEHIRANTIVINETSGLAKVLRGALNYGESYIVLPPMICGMESYISSNGELPKGIGFALFEAPQTERDRIYAQGKMEAMGTAAKTFVEQLKKMLDAGWSSEDILKFFQDCYGLEE